MSELKDELADEFMRTWWRMGHADAMRVAPQAVTAAPAPAPEPVEVATADEEPEALPSFDLNRRITPPQDFDPLHAEFQFTIDVAADAETARLPRYFAPAPDGAALGDGLFSSWANERVFCNPPYNKTKKVGGASPSVGIPPWIQKAWKEAPTAQLIVLLVPAWTDRDWWQKLVEPFREKVHQTPHGAVHFSTRFLERIKFGYPGNPTGKGVGSPKFIGSSLLIWRHE